MYDCQCGWKLCLHHVRHEAAKAARPSACRLSLGDILQTFSEEIMAKFSIQCGVQIQSNSQF